MRDVLNIWSHVPLLAGNLYTLPSQGSMAFMPSFGLLERTKRSSAFNDFPQFSWSDLTDKGGDPQSLVWFRFIWFCLVGFVLVGFVWVGFVSFGFVLVGFVLVGFVSFGLVSFGFVSQTTVSPSHAQFKFNAAQDRTQNIPLFGSVHFLSIKRHFFVNCSNGHAPPLS